MLGGVHLRHVASQHSEHEALQVLSSQLVSKLIESASNCIGEIEIPVSKLPLANDLVRGMSVVILVVHNTKCIIT